MADEKITGNISDMLWVLTKSMDSVCAVDSNCVQAIYLLEEPITKTPNSDSLNVGIVKFRGEILPVIDLRHKLGLKSLEQELQEFDDMLEHRKQDHIHWVDELERSIMENTKFSLATDPHKCAFGKWYDNYIPTNSTIAFHLKKIDEPHKRLHAAADKVFACKQECELCTRERCLKEVLEDEAKVYMSQVVGLLEETKKVFRDERRKMIVVLAEQASSCGILVDEVLSVESLTEVEKSDHIKGTEVRSVVSKIAQRKNDSNLILILDQYELLNTPENNAQDIQ